MSCRVSKNEGLAPLIRRVTDYAHILTRNLTDSRPCATVGGTSRM